MSTTATTVTTTAAESALPPTGIMDPRSKATRRRAERLGLLLGLVGVVSFSLTLPMTRLAVAELSPWLVAFGRMALAGVIAAIWLVATRAPRPQASELPLLAATSFGVVLGFPLLSTLAMRTVPAHHGAVIVGALPFATALLAALWFGERHSRRFWLCAIAGSVLVVIFALRGDGSPHAVAANDPAPAPAWTFRSGDLALFGAVLAAALGYASGGRLAARMGGANAILWALVLALPMALPATLLLARSTPLTAGAAAWIGFAYITLVSQLAGFFAWYNGLVLGGIGRVGQLQLLQVFFTIAAASLIFNEQVRPDTWIFALAVVATLAAGRGLRIRNWRSES